MVGLYINGNGKYQYVMDKLLYSEYELNLSKTCKKDWKYKLERYSNFYEKGQMSSQLKLAAINKYDNIGTVEMAVATYIEEDMDNFLEKVKRICNLYRVQ